MLDYGVDPEYFMDRMQLYEIRSLVKFSYHRHKDDYEIGRLIAYVTAQVNSKKRLKMKDICEFPWEREDFGISAKQHIQNQKNDVIRMTNAMKMMQQNLHTRYNNE